MNTRREILKGIFGAGVAALIPSRFLPKLKAPVVESNFVPSKVIPLVGYSEFGNCIRLTRSMLINDDLEVFSGIARSLGAEAARAEDEAIVQLLRY